jgi:hypothetical protein
MKASRKRIEGDIMQEITRDVVIILAIYLAALAPEIMGPAALFVSVAVFSSSVAALQSTMVSQSRTLQAMAHYRAVPACFGRLSKYKTLGTTRVVAALDGDHGVLLLRHHRPGRVLVLRRQLVCLVAELLLPVRRCSRPATSATSAGGHWRRVRRCCPHPGRWRDLEDYSSDPCAGILPRRGDQGRFGASGTGHAGLRRGEGCDSGAGSSNATD